MSQMHIGICGPVAAKDIACLMGMDANELPKGYEGAPLLVTLIAGMLSAGHRVSVFTLSNDLKFSAGAVRVQSKVNSQLDLTFCPLRPRAWQFCEGRPGRILDLYKHERSALIRAIQEVSPQVIHAHWAYEFAWAALDSSVPTVVTCHDSPLRVACMNTWAKPTISLYRWLRVLMARQVFRRAKHVTAVSPYMQQVLASITSQPVAVVPNPVDSRLIERGRDRQLGPRVKVAMISNGWDHIKNAKPALLAFARMRSLNPSLELHLFGHDFQADGPAESWCRSHGEIAPALASIQFHGPVSHAALMNELDGMDLLLHPSLEESFGMVLVEAMALGIPVVAGAHSGAVPWVVQDERCLCDARDAYAIAQTAHALLVPTTYAELSSSLRAMVSERFALGAVREQYLKAFIRAQSLVSGGSDGHVQAGVSE